jgi:hypothetical protein
MSKELGKTHAYDGRMAQAAPFYAEMTHFTLPLHALREELIAPVSAQPFLVRNPDCLVMVLEPVTDDGLRATAITSRMADVLDFAEEG